MLRYRPDLAHRASSRPSARTPRPATGCSRPRTTPRFLGSKFAYATNGHGIVEFDFHPRVGARPIRRFPDARRAVVPAHSPAVDYRPDAAERLLTPAYHLSGKSPRYYQEIAINRAVQAILQGQQRMLLTMATGTGKTVVAFQICWKLWSARWNRDRRDYRRPRILYLADRNILVDDPKDKTFAPFGDARWKIESGEAIKSREMYFAIYQAIAKDENRPGLYREYAPDFFDLIIVDECHRGSARDESNWREILEYFEPAFQLGMTATPQPARQRRHLPLLRRSDLHLQPAAGHRRRLPGPVPRPPRRHDVGCRRLATRARATWTGTAARFPTTSTTPTTSSGRRAAGPHRGRRPAPDRVPASAPTAFAKTIVFCVDQEHADEMRRALNNLNTDLVQQYPDYVCRVTSDEGDIGRGHLSKFQDLETRHPGHPDDVAAADDRRGCPDVQERRAGARRSTP